MKVSIQTYQRLVGGGIPHNPDDRWTSYTPETYDSGVSSVTVDEDGKYELPEGTQRAYVVWVEYGDGDTFRSQRGLISLLDVFASEEKATKLKEMVEKDYADTKMDVGTKFRFKYEGKEHHKEWAGYFKHLERVHVNVLLVIPENE